MKTFTSLDFVLWLITQPDDRRYDQTQQVSSDKEGSLLIQFAKEMDIPKPFWCGGMDVYDKAGKVIACLERSTQAHFDHVDMEGRGTFGKLKVRSLYLQKLEKKFKPYENKKHYSLAGAGLPQ